jgi:hypothetical protein
VALPERSPTSDQFSDVNAAANQSTGDAPLERSQIQGGAGDAHQANRAHLLHGFHHDNRRGRIEQDFQAFEGVGHKGLTICDLLP